MKVMYVSHNRPTHMGIYPEIGHKLGKKHDVEYGRLGWCQVDLPIPLHTTRNTCVDFYDQDWWT